MLSRMLFLFISFVLLSVVASAAAMPFKVVNLSERDIGGRNQVCLRFSQPLDAREDFQSFFSISRKGGGLVSGAWVVSSGDRLACFSHSQPATEYLVTVYQGLAAKSGDKLAHDFHQSIKTRRLEPAVSFGSRGSVLLPGVSPGLPVESVNVPAVDITFHRVRSVSTGQVLDELGSGYPYGLMRSLGQYSDLVYTGRFALDAPENQRVKRTIPMQDIAELQRPGLYLAVMKAAGSYPDVPVVTHFSVTDLGLMARRYVDRLDVYINSLTDAVPVSGVVVSLVDAKGQVIAQTRTTNSGYASFTPVPDKAVLLLAKKGANESLLRLKGPALDLSEFDIGVRPQAAQTLFIYSERDIYRPGEVVHVNALLRDGDGRLQGAPTLKARLLQPDGQVVRRVTLRGTTPGYYQVALALPEHAATGGWRFEVDKPDGKVAGYPFKVEEFLPERMKLAFAPGAAARMVLAADAPLRVPVKGEYLYGAPASGNRLSSVLRVSHWRSPIDSLKGFEFGDVRDNAALGSRELEDIFLDANGEGVIAADNSWKQTRSPLKLSLIGSLYESGGRPVSRRYDVLVWPDGALLGIRPEFAKDENPPENSRVRFDIVRATLQGEKLAAKSVEVTLVREDRQYFWEYSEQEGWHYESSDQEYPVETRTLSIAAGEHATVELPVEWGRYRLEVRDNVTGRQSSLRFFAGTDWYAEREASRQSSRPDVVGLALDKPAYRAGDVAKLSIQPPHDGEALVLVEAGDALLWKQRLAVGKAGATVEIPIDAAWHRHDIYIAVVVLRAASEVASITPNRAMGLLHLPLDREDRKLAMAIQSTDKAEPGKPLPVVVRLQQPPVTKQPIYVTVAAVDTGILSLTDFATPDPNEGFFGRRRYAVESRDLYGDLIELNKYKKASLSFGGDAPSRGGKAPAADIQIVSLYRGPLQFDAKGEAKLDFDIPDFNGRLRLMAVAFGDDVFGSAEREVTIAAPVVTQLAIPRFLASGDETTFALDVRNMSGQAQSLALTLVASEPLAIRAANQKLSLTDGERKTLQFPVSAGSGARAASIQLDVAGDKLAFSRDWSIAIRPPYPKVQQRQQRRIDPEKQADFDLDMLDHLLPYSVAAELRIDDQLDLAAKQQFSTLLQYPYGCLEQTASSTWPWLYADADTIQRLGLPAVTAQSRLQSIEKGLQHIEAMQLPNGGFGLWNNHSAEEHWLTAYTADLLLDAEQQGFPVQAQMKENALKRLQAYLRQPHLGFERFTAFGDHYRFAWRAYAGWVLSRVNRASLGQLRSLYDHHKADARSGLPLVHLGLALLRQGDRRRGEQAVLEGLQKKRDDELYLGDYGSAIRDDATIVKLLAGKPAFQGAVADKLPALAEAVADRQYLSTQERNALFLAALALSDDDDNVWAARLRKGAEQVAIRQRAAFSTDLAVADMVNGVAVDNLSQTILWASLNLSGYPEQAPEPVSAGYEIKREYFNREGKPLDISTLHSGDLVLVHLAITAPKRMQDTLVVDLLPAGLELENQNLEHSIKLENFRIDGKSLNEVQRDTEVIHEEFRDDRYVAAIDHGKYGQQSHLFYLARAVTPGNYRVPPPSVEDMYRPQYRAIGDTVDQLQVINARR